MPKVVAYDDVKVARERRKATGGQIWRTFFMRPQVAGIPRDPYAFLSEGDPKRVLVTHFHRVDQFQVIVAGDGLMGKHKLGINAVHFARANTPYGPLVNGDQGLAFLTLRSMGDPSGQHHMPEAKDELMSIPKRHPWQVSEMAQFDQSGEISVREFAKIKDERGLAAFSLRLNPGAQIFAPDPSKSDGQYVIVTKGSLIYEGKDCKALTIAFVKPDEKPLGLEAGRTGLEALVLNFPRQPDGAPC